MNNVEPGDRNRWGRRPTLNLHDLMRANLEGAAAAGADFTGANLYQAETWRARMEGAKLLGANVTGTKLG